MNFINHSLIFVKQTSGGGEETPILGVASYTNCVGYTCPPEGPAGLAQLPVGKTSAAHISARDIRHAEQIQGASWHT